MKIFELYCWARELVYAGYYALFYGADVPLELHGLTDANWVGRHMLHEWVHVFSW